MYSFETDEVLQQLSNDKKGGNGTQVRRSRSNLYVIVRGIEKRQILKEQVDRSRFAERIVSLAAETQTGINARAMLTDHALLLELKAGSRA